MARKKYTIPKKRKAELATYYSPVDGKVTVMPEGDEKKMAVSAILYETLNSFNQVKVRNERDFETRVSTFFSHCAKTGEKPTLESLALAVGYTIGQLKDVESGRAQGWGGNAHEQVQRAKAFLQAFDARLVLDGLLHPTPYMFRAKNFYNMKDSQENIIVPAPAFERSNDEDLGKKYLKQIPQELTSEEPTSEEL